MSESAPDFLRTHELRLLYCTFSSLPSDCPAASQTQTSPNGLHECLDIFVNSIVAGDYQKALASNAARLVLGLVNPCQFTDSTECAEQVYAELLECAEKFVISKFENEEDRLCRLMIVVCIAIASFLSFTQSNVSGWAKLTISCRLSCFFFLSSGFLAIHLRDVRWWDLTIVIFMSNLCFYFVYAIF